MEENIVKFEEKLKELVALGKMCIRDRYKGK